MSGLFPSARAARPAHTTSHSPPDTLTFQLISAMSRPVSVTLLPCGVPCPRPQ